MPRKAFLLGRNTGRLRHCFVYGEADERKPCDVQYMHSALSKHDYHITIAKKEDNAGQIHNNLCELTDACAEEDTLIIYFSGHSLVRNHILYLVLADPVSNSRNLFSTQMLISLLENCKAGEKLLILDCCDSGQSAFEWTPGRNDRFRVLTATGQLGKSKEFDDLNAGVFTYHLHKALTEPCLCGAGETGVLDTDRVLRIAKLYEWLKKEVPAYGRRKDRKVLTPELYGAASQNVALTGRLPEHSFLSSELLNKLKKLLTQAGLPKKTLHSVFHDFLNRIDLSLPFPDCPGEDLHCVLNYLTDTGYLLDTNVVPLLEFVAFLQDHASNAEKLRAWVIEAVAELKHGYGISDLPIGQCIRPAAAPQPSYVQMEIAPTDANACYYTAQSWVCDAKGGLHPAYVEDTSFTPAKMPELLAHVYEHDEVRKIRKDKSIKHPLTFEFFLPADLLDADIVMEEWLPGQEPGGKPSKRKSPLDFHHRAVVCCRERARAEDYIDGWAALWNGSAHCFKKKADKCMGDWLEEDGDYISLLDSGMIFLALAFKPGSENLRYMLESGASIILWPRSNKGLEQSAKRKLEAETAQSVLANLPEALRKTRRALWGQSHRSHTGRLRLLWDDPGRGLPKTDTLPLLDPNEDI
ncbi:MAG: hypothetical protein GY862_37925 [Gammaproteobacteria bacterium]|nr:hypothetical protein [Gammaproteobacteria bacterium]